MKTSLKYDATEIANLKASANIATVMEQVASVQFSNNKDKRTCKCPFHNDNHPSLQVDVVKGTYKCFVCGAGGDVFAFVMEYQKCDFIEAVERVAAICNYELTPATKLDPVKLQQRNERAALVACNKLAVEFFKEELSKDAKAKEYVLSRWNEESVEHWDIGLAPEDRSLLLKYLLKKKVSPATIRNSDLFRVQDMDSPRPYCTFSNRVMFPIRNNIGEVVGFTGRVLPWNDKPYTDSDGKTRNTPKYINTTDVKEKHVFVKGNVLFGFDYARKSIRENNEAVLVEGNPDVVKLHEIGITNVVAACGTALTKMQVDLIAKSCRSVVMLYDSDDAGVKATLKNGPILTMSGLATYVLNIPNGENGAKQDPDTFFTSAELYQEFSQANKIPFVEWYTAKNAPQNDDPSEISDLMADVAKMLATMSETEWMGHIAKLGRIVGDKSRWEVAVRAIVGSTIKVNEDGLTNRQQQNVERYGFYEKNNCYFIKRGIKDEYGEQVSNFVMEPLFHIASKVSAKRIYRLRNCIGITRDIEITQKDLCSKAAFCACVESVGNFLFLGKEADLGKIKQYLYDNTLTCTPIEQLGWQPEGQFWAWSNGIVPRDGNFIPVNELGIVKYAEQYYYMPACSSINAMDTEFYSYERRFVHKSSDAELATWADLYYRTFSENSMVSISFYIASLFRDISFARVRSFPILSVFGQPGSGKTKFFMSILRLFGDAQEGPSLETASAAGVGDQLAKIHNGVIHFDEYKNNINPKIIGNLKGVYEGRGRLKMDMSRDGMRMQTKVDSGLMLSGQEKTTADEALFERTIFLEFRADPKIHALTAEDFERLKTYEDARSLTPITNYLLSFRHIIEECYFENYKMVKESVSKIVKENNVKARTIECYSVILTYMKILDGKISLPFTYEQILDVFVKKMLTQKDEMAMNDPVARFWKGVKSMLFDGKICDEVDLRITNKANFDLTKGSRDTKETIHYDGTYRCLLLNPDRLFDLYAEKTARTRALDQSSLGSSSLISYLQSQNYYMGSYKTSFRKPVADDEERYIADNEGRLNARTDFVRSNALVFDYEEIKKIYELNFEVSPTDSKL